ncbi:hypothetical protein CHARACLAT_002528 [Characodon lateralis]|uniref:Secreted protein n=1 Tax=Characodon lateralis TaxID=208331 RepID=A0ABU7E6H3_9TELE|nr:hypothetical protein [Characodon lateralis]
MAHCAQLLSTLISAAAARTRSRATAHGKRKHSVLSALYKSWCLFLREPLRVVTELEISSGSSSSFAFRTSLKNLKMDSKLIQEINAAVLACSP